MPRHLIALDNRKYAVLDLQPEPEQEDIKRDLLEINTGIGGYMPRYVARTIEEGGLFSVTVMC